MYIRPLPLDNKAHIEHLARSLHTEDDVRGMKILNHRLESFFGYYKNPLRHYINKRLNWSAKPEKLLSTTHLSQKIIQPKEIIWIAPKTYNNDTSYDEQRVVVKFITKGCKIIETVGSKYYDEDPIRTPYKDCEKLYVYYPKKLYKDNQPYATSGNYVRVSLKFNSVAATVASREFCELITDVIKQWKIADKEAFERYKEATVLPVIHQQIKSYPIQFAEWEKTIRNVKGVAAAKIRTCIRRMKHDISEYMKVSKL